MATDGSRQSVTTMRVRRLVGDGSVMQRLIERIRRRVTRARSILDKIYLTPRGDSGEWEGGLRGL